MRRFLTAMLVLCSGAGLASAQSSASYELEQYAFNAGGAPSAGAPLVSPSYRVTLGSLGDAVTATGLSSASYSLDLGPEIAYRPPGEVDGLLLDDKQTLVWTAERSAGRYNLYRDDTSDGYGNCAQQDIATNTATDPATPSSGAAFHYLVTAVNRLDEQGTKGFRSDGTTERLGSTDPPACP